MKLKNFTLKTLAALTLLLTAFVVNAQVQQTIDLGDPTVYNYTVDTSSDPTQPLLNDQPNGTAGSTYAWSIINAAAPAAVITPTGNRVSIDWSAVPVGIYHVNVIETNAGCPPETVEFEVEIVLPGDPTLNWADTAPICSGDDATFEITGAPAGAVISFTATGGIPATGTATADASGNATIVITHDGTSATIVVNLVLMVVGGNTITFTPVITDTANVNIVLTSPIQLVP